MFTTNADKLSAICDIDNVCKVANAMKQYLYLLDGLFYNHTQELTLWTSKMRWFSGDGKIV